MVSSPYLCEYIPQPRYLPHDSAITSATLLLPEHSWGDGYVVAAPSGPTDQSLGSPIVAIVAAEDGTDVTLKPNATVDAASPRVPSIAVGSEGTIHLDAGEFVQIVHNDGDPSGGVIHANRPIGVFGGADCLLIPEDLRACDSIQQQIPPVSALGNEYAAVRYRSRAPHSRISSGDQRLATE